MKAAIVTAGFAAIGQSYAQTSSPRVKPVPSYNASLPIDHFNAADTRTFNNRFFVNDTFYKQGGPVIIYDFGSTTISDATAARYLGEYDGAISAPMEVAKALNGVVVGWENRYYGKSLPFAVNSSENASANDLNRYVGIPLDGAAAYKYLTVEQSLQDVVYFANNVFNRTTLGGNNTVLAGTNSLQLLDPYHTPWIWIGGSSSGSRGAWLRLRNPEVIHAVWASSAPVETRVDGSAFLNPIYRALPTNCSADMHAVGQEMDRILTSGNDVAILHLKTMYFAATGQSISSNNTNSPIAGAGPAGLTNYALALTLLRGIADGVSSFGVSTTVQIFCDFMASFDAQAYLDRNATTNATDFLQSNRKAPPTQNGIVATYGERGPRAGLAAYFYAFRQYFLSGAFYGPRLQGGSVSREEVSVALHSWSWQQATELGGLAGVNSTSPISLGSRFYSAAETLKTLKSEAFPAFDPAVFPPEPAVANLQKYGGWGMQPSNTMFTNGEFDLSRPYSVFSGEQDTLGAPARVASQTVPKCGTPPPGNDVFGLLFKGATNLEDVLWIPRYRLGAPDLTQVPLRTASQLFVKAYQEWQSCFNATRGVAPKPNSGISVTSNGAGAWKLMGILCITSFLVAL